MKRQVLVLGIAAVLAIPLAAEAKSLRIENKREVALTELTITAKAGDTKETFVLARDVAPRSIATRQVPQKSCLYDVKGTFADQSTLQADDLNLCAQNVIRLVK